MKNVKTPFGILALMLALASCSNDDSATQNQLRIKANAVYSPTANRTVNGAAINENVTLSSFKVNIKEIEFEYAENDDNDDDDEEGDEPSEKRSDENIPTRVFVIGDRYALVDNRSLYIKLPPGSNRCSDYADCHE